MAAKHLEPGRGARAREGICVTLALAAALTVRAACIGSGWFGPRSSAAVPSCSQGAPTPVAAVRGLLEASARGDWGAACRTVDGNVESTRDAFEGMSMASKPAIAPVRSTKPGWARVDVEARVSGLSGTSVVSVWTKPVSTQDGRTVWVVSIDGK